ncbi:NAD(P)/FAD-dependent oxidoreductase [Thermodesulfobacteriota bacterium]
MSLTELKVPDNTKADIVIIGGGVIGLCIAYYTACEGASVILIEQNRIPSGCSYGNAGLIVPSRCQPLPAPKIIAEGFRHLFSPSGSFSIRLRPDPEMLWWLWIFYRSCNEKHFFHAVEILKELSLESLRLHEDLAQQGGSIYEYDYTGLLSLFGSKKAFRKGQEDARLMGKIGAESRVMTGHEVRDLEPTISSRVSGAVWYRRGSRLNPASFLMWLEQKARKNGVQFVKETEVVGFNHNRQHIDAVHTTRGEFRGDQFVLAAGAWTSSLLKTLNARLPIQGGKGYSLTFRRPQKSSRTPMILEDFHIAVTPFNEMFRLAGYIELSGLELGIDLNRLNRIRQHAQQFLPGIGDLKLIEIWRGLRPCTPDGLPVMGKLLPIRNLWVAGGHATKGISLGPVTGKLMTGLLSGKSIGALEHDLRADRF